MHDFSAVAFSAETVWWMIVHMSLYCLSMQRHASSQLPLYASSIKRMLARGRMVFDTVGMSIGGKMWMRQLRTSCTPCPSHTQKVSVLPLHCGRLVFGLQRNGLADARHACMYNQVS